MLSEAVGLSRLTDVLETGDSGLQCHEVNIRVALDTHFAGQLPCASHCFPIFYVFINRRSSFHGLNLLSRSEKMISPPYMNFSILQKLDK